MSNGYCAWCGRGDQSSLTPASISSSTEKLVTTQDNTCWHKILAFFGRTAIEAPPESYEEYAKYQRKTTEPFQLGTTHSTITSIDDGTAKKSTTYRRYGSILRSVNAVSVNGAL